MSSQKATVLSLYRRSLKLAMDWTVHRYAWRGQAMYLRSLFEANRHVTNPKLLGEIIKETEHLLHRWRHPEPYIAPGAPGGTKYERNLPMPRLEPPVPHN